MAPISEIYMFKDMTKSLARKVLKQRLLEVGVILGCSGRTIRVMDL